MTGLYEGTMADGKVVQVHFSQKDNTVSGLGTLEGKTFSLSAVTSWYGPAIIAFENNFQRRSTLQLSPDGSTVQMNWLGKQVLLHRTNHNPLTASGAFSGVYVTYSPYPVWIRLHQQGQMLTGNGFITQKPVALAGTLTTSGCIRGSVLYSDESSVKVEACLSADNQTLTFADQAAPATKISLTRREP